MAFSDLEKQYQNIKANYFNLINYLEEFDKQRSAGILEDKKFKAFKKRVEKVKNSYETLAYFFMLWAKPDNDEIAEINNAADIAYDSLADKDKIDEDTWKAQYKSSYNYLSKRDPEKIFKKDSRILNEIKDYVENLKGKE